MRLRQEMESLRAAMSRCETTLSQVAGAAQVETLGLVVEEQRQRIDSIITGKNFHSMCEYNPCSLLLISNFEYILFSTPLFLYLQSGSTAIESITEEFVRQQGDIAELQAFLQLPQHKPLRAQLDEAGELMDGE